MKKTYYYVWGVLLLLLAGYTRVEYQNTSNVGWTTMTTQSADNWDTSSSPSYCDGVAYDDETSWCCDDYTIFDLKTEQCCEKMGNIEPIWEECWWDIATWGWWAWSSSWNLSYCDGVAYDDTRSWCCDDYTIFDLKTEQCCHDMTVKSIWEECWTFWWGGWWAWPWRTTG